MEKEVLVNDVDALALSWAELKSFLEKEKKLKYELFEEVFSKTYALLQECAKDHAIDKKYMKLIVNAYNFANTSVASSEYLPQAAFVLTERMLQFFVMINEAQDLSDHGVNVYVLEARQEIYIDFKNLDRSIETLVNIFKKNH